MSNNIICAAVACNNEQFPLQGSRKIYCSKRCRRLTNLEIERERKGSPTRGADTWTWDDVIDIWADDLYQRQADRAKVKANARKYCHAI